MIIIEMHWLNKIPYFLDYTMHLGFRGGKEGEKNLLPHRCLPHPHPLAPGKLHSDYKMYPHFPPKFASHSPQNMVYSTNVTHFFLLF